MRHAMQGHRRRMGQCEVLRKRGPLEERMPNHSIFLLGEPMCSMKRRKYMIMEDENLLRSEGVQYAAGEEQNTITNISRKNEVAGPMHKWCLVVDVSGGENKVHCCKEQYCIQIEDKRRRGWQRMRWLDSTTNTMVNLSKLPGIVEGMRAWHSTVHGITENQTWLSNWITTTADTYTYIYLPSYYQWLF